mmetsp:Transcript_48872/g.123995  ORF Transcript_48872/g.123995 Transcript_48872/m.123995 type:complete len:226 (+) Transcript_48872:285-962(+)
MRHSSLPVASDGGSPSSRRCPGCTNGGGPTGGGGGPPPVLRPGEGDAPGDASLEPNDPKAVPPGPGGPSHGGGAQLPMHGTVAVAVGGGAVGGAGGKPVAKTAAAVDNVAIAPLEETAALTSAAAAEAAAAAAAAADAGAAAVVGCQGAASAESPLLKTDGDDCCGAPVDPAAAPTALLSPLPSPSPPVGVPTEAAGSEGKGGDHPRGDGADSLPSAPTVLTWAT